MAKADHIKKLIASFGRNQEFRAAALRIIDDAANQGKRPFAELLTCGRERKLDVRRMLRGPRFGRNLISKQLKVSGHAACPKLSKAFLCRGSFRRMSGYGMTPCGAKRTKP